MTASDVARDEGGEPSDQPRVFISYSRKDREKAQRLSKVLSERNFGVFRDTDDILPTEEWRDRLEELIREADTIVFLLSPNSATSEVCAWEVELAHELEKRIAPIVIEDVEGSDIPPLLARLNFIFCTDRDPFEDAVDTMVSALNTDIDWIREHTRLAGLARRWDKSARAGTLLLRGGDIAAAESWRDTRPKDAPQITPLQLTFIAESRRAAIRRQRMTVVLSLAAVVVGFSLAAIAYWQRNEANRQRAEVTRQLAAENLRAGDSAAAASALLNVDPDSTALKSVLAGLAKAGETTYRDNAGTPFILNGQLYFSQTDAPPIKSESLFPATGWTDLGEDVLMVTDAARSRRVDREGKTVTEGPALNKSAPCAIHRGTQGVTVINRYIRGYSACSIGLELVFTPYERGDFRTTSPEPCARINLELEGPDGPFTPDALKLTEACGPGDGNAFFQTATELHSELEPLRPFEIVRFPGAAKEDGLWTGERDGAAILRRQLERMTERGLSGGPIARLESQVAEGISQGGFLFVDDMSHGDTVAFIMISIYGGTGGETFLACLRAAPDSPLNCKSFWTSGGGVTGALAADGQRLAVYGRELVSESSRANIWVLKASGEYEPYGGLDGDVLSAAFAPDGRLAALTTGALTIFNATGVIESQTRRPGLASAVAWAQDGDVILLGEDGLRIGNPDRGYGFTPLTPPPLTTAANGEPRDLWIAQDAGAGLLALGYGVDVVIHDLALDAPLTRPFRIPHPRLESRLSAAYLEGLADGSFHLDIAGERYERRGWTDGDPAALLNPEEAFR